MNILAIPNVGIINHFIILLVVTVSVLPPLESQFYLTSLLDIYFRLNLVGRVGFIVIVVDDTSKPHTSILVTLILFHNILPGVICRVPI